jgi:hypothetical protein
MAEATTLRRSHTLTNIKPMLQAHRARSGFSSRAFRCDL